jgi:hypothetical protein
MLAIYEALQYLNRSLTVSHLVEEVDQCNSTISVCQKVILVELWQTLAAYLNQLLFVEMRTVTLYLSQLQVRPGYYKFLSYDLLRQELRLFVGTSKQTHAIPAQPP